MGWIKFSIKNAYSIERKQNKLITKYLKILNKKL